ncbi:UNVERIFIED_ORG: hypothetical protein GGR68_004136 [Xanthomonas campestris]|nr:hypothetical protein [Xanthomonas arboricola]
MRLQQRTVGGRDDRDSIAMLSRGLERIGIRHRARSAGAEQASPAPCDWLRFLPEPG